MSVENGNEITAGAMAAASPLHVMAGALIDGHGLVLIAQRPPGKHMAGFWEFPGGKLEADEERRAGLARELREELGVEVIDAHPLIVIRHDYPDRQVVLDIWRVLHFSGIPAGHDGQALRWCEVEQLASADVLPADWPAITALRLPDRLRSMRGANYELVGQAALAKSSSNSHRGEILLGALCADARAANDAAMSGADFVAVRGLLPVDELRELCHRVNLPVYCRGMSLEQAWRAGARGLCEDVCNRRR